MIADLNEDFKDFKLKSFSDMNRESPNLKSSTSKEETHFSKVSLFLTFHLHFYCYLHFWHFCV